MKPSWSRVAIWGVVLLGLGIRVFNYCVRPPTLWQDEAYWAVKALTTAAIDAQIRPLGFMLVTQGALRVFGAAAWVYRTLPFLGSVLSLLLTPYLVTRLFRAYWSQLLATVLLALSPVAIEMAAEFKHYGTEVGVYVAVLAVLLRYFEQRTLRNLILVLGVAWVSFFFSLTVIFTYPALFAALAWDAWRTHKLRWLLAVVGAAVVCLATIGTIYFTTWRTISAGKAEQKWGSSYDVFYIGGGRQTEHDSRASWTVAKYFELASVPGIGRELWRSAQIPEPKLEQLKSADRVLWSVLHLAGLLLLLRRRRFLELAALWSPLLLVTAFNLAGRWPAGAFRTNTFYVPYAVFIASLASEWLLEVPRDWAKRFVGPAFAALLLLPTVHFRPGIARKGLWTKPGAITEAFMLLPPSPGGRPRKLLMDFASCRPWEYYAFHDEPFAKRRPDLRREYKADCRRRQRDLLGEFQRLLRTEPRGFAILLTDDRKYPSMRKLARRSCASLTEDWVKGQTHLVMVCSGAK
jgi:hypothetical protein